MATTKLIQVGTSLWLADNCIVGVYARTNVDGPVQPEIFLNTATLGSVVSDWSLEMVVAAVNGD